jgi:hypothetical protein
MLTEDEARSFLETRTPIEQNTHMKVNAVPPPVPSALSRLVSLLSVDCAVWMLTPFRNTANMKTPIRAARRAQQPPPRNPPPQIKTTSSPKKAKIRNRKKGGMLNLDTEWLTANKTKTRNKKKKLRRV